MCPHVFEVKFTIWHFSLMFEPMCADLFILCDLNVKHVQLSQLSKGTVTP